MLCIKVPLKDAQKVKKQLLAKRIFRNDYLSKKNSEYIYFPIKEKFETKYKFVQKLMKKSKKQTQNIKIKLKKKLSSKDFKKVKTSMDVIGNIAIIEIPDEINKKEKIIAQQVLNTNKIITTVLKKGKHKGTFRTQKLKFLAGKKTKEAIYKENNITLKLDVEKVYFSPRLSNERKRIYQQVKKQEEILVMFSGCAPYVCTIAKNTNAKHITGVEINPEGHNYAIQNLLLNKLNNISTFLGDVKNIVPKLNKKFDRIIMPLPKTAEEFLDVALKVSKKGTIIHLYNFKHEDNFQETTDSIKEACKKEKKKCRILRTVRCGQHAPRTYRICVDFKVL